MDDREYYFQSTAIRRRQNRVRFRPRDKRLALKSAEGYIRFHLWLLLMFESPSINTTILSVQLCGCKTIIGQLE
jgi:hypothetical protein